MNFEKQIRYLLHLNRDDFNRADRKIEKVLLQVFERGKKVGKKEQKKQTMSFIKSIK